MCQAEAVKAVIKTVELNLFKVSQNPQLGLVY